MPDSANHSLRVGLLALERALITRDQLLSGLAAWANAQSQPLQRHLEVEGALTDRQWEQLEKLLDKSNSTVSLSSTIDKSPGGPPSTLPWKREAAAAGRVRPGPRFQVISLHAQGGLGQVSIARDERLGRRVALKEIRPDRAADTHLRQRFLNEAEITGQLEHPGIVPIYALEEDAGGQPFYAMRFIQGRTLGDAIGAYHRNPTSLTFRELLKHFVAVCQTIAFAHSKEVIHRDLKPANIMLGDYGETLVVDWGLAKRLSDSTEPVTDAACDWNRPEADLTVEGQAVGTPAYMSPEQARGDTQAVGPATDTYALGAILYSILTNRPPYIDKPEAIIAALTSGQSPPPPRSKNRVVPRALEAVCLKALSPTIDQRYTTAAALAADVELYLADEAVTAYREPMAIRARRWIRRRPALVASSAASVLLGGAFLAVLLAVVAFANRRLDAANDELKGTNHRLQAAVTLAQDQNKLALQTLNFVVFQVERELAKVVGAAEIRRTILKGVHERLQQVSDRYQAPAEIDRNSAIALGFLGDLLMESGSGSSRGERADNAGGTGALDAAHGHYGRAHAIFLRLAEAAPRDNEAQRDLEISYARLGDIAMRKGQLGDAKSAYDSGLAIALRLAKESPAEARAQRDLAFCYDHDGSLAVRQGNMTQAGKSYRQALAIRERLASGNPPDAEALRDLPDSYSKLAALAMQTGEHDRARDDSSKGLETLKRLAANESTDRDLLAKLANAYDAFGHIAWGMDDAIQARQCFQEGLTIRQQLAAADNDDAQAQRDLTVSYSTLADLSQQVDGDLQPAREWYQQSLAIRTKLAAADAADARAQSDLAMVYNKLGSLEEKSRDLTAARGYYQSSLEIREQALKSAPKDREARRNLAIGHQSLGNIALLQGGLDESRKSYQAMVDLLKPLAGDDPNDARSQFDLSIGYEKLGDIALQSEALSEASENYEQCREIRRQLVQAGRGDARTQRGLSIALEKLGDAAFNASDLGRAREFYEQALASRRQRAEAGPENAEAQRDMMLSLYRMGKMAQSESQWSEAIAAFSAGRQTLVEFRKRSGTDAFAAEIEGLDREIEQCRKTQGLKSLESKE